MIKLKKASGESVHGVYYRVTPFGNPKHYEDEKLNEVHIPIPREVSLAELLALTEAYKTR